MKKQFARGVREIRGLPRPVQIGIGGGLWIVTVGFVAIVYDLPSALLSGTVAVSTGLLVIPYKRRHPDKSPLQLCRALIDLRRPTVSEVGLAAVGVGIIIGAELAFGIIHATLLSGGDLASHDVTVGVETSSPQLPTVILLFLWVAGVGPFIEEIVFRNGIQKLLTYSVRPEAAIAITSGAFALLHVPSYGGFTVPVETLLLPVTVVFTGSLVFGVLFWHTSNVAVPTLAHMGFNGVVLLYSVVI